MIVSKLKRTKRTPACCDVCKHAKDADKSGKVCKVNTYKGCRELRTRLASGKPMEFTCGEYADVDEGSPGHCTCDSFVLASAEEIARRACVGVERIVLELL